MIILFYVSFFSLFLFSLNSISFVITFTFCWLVNASTANEKHFYNLYTYITYSVQSVPLHFVYVCMHVYVYRCAYERNVICDHSTVPAGLAFEWFIHLTVRMFMQRLNDNASQSASKRSLKRDFVVAFDYIHDFQDWMNTYRDILLAFRVRIWNCKKSFVMNIRIHMINMFIFCNDPI